MLTRIAVLVSGGGTNLQALLDAQDVGALHSGHIELVIASRPDAYALERAKSHVIPAVCVERKGKKQATFEAELQALLSEYRIDLIILAGFLCILSPEFVARWPRRILNIHPALLPAFCGKGYYGLKVHEAVLARGVRVTGATVHFVNEIPDGGEILYQKAVPVEKNDTPESLQHRVMEQAEWVLLPRAAEQVSAEIAKEKEHDRPV
ncbi:MAG: phosphoribosylglycinamide formyltransferase [Clostridiaceae bacterium]|nr:phosphoribosylglycinamide formyltransferase [Clostridiaceae bacterium]